MGNTVKRADPHSANGQIQEGFDPRPHLRGSLVGEGHGQDPMGRHPLGLDQPGNSMNENPRLAAAGARDHQGVAKGGRDSFPLVLVQMLENVRDVHCYPP